MKKEVLVITKVGQTISHDGDVLLVCKGDMPADKTVLFLSEHEYEKIIAQFDVSIIS